MRVPESSIPWGIGGCNRTVASIESQITGVVLREGVSWETSERQITVGRPRVQECQSSRQKGVKTHAQKAPKGLLREAPRGLQKAARRPLRASKRLPEGL